MAKKSSPISKRTVIVTGAGKGLGRAFAMSCAQAGCAVVVNNRHRTNDIDSAAAVVDEIRAAGGEATANYADVTAQDAPDSLLETALSNYGRLDSVILNAGTTGTPAHFDEMDPNVFDMVMKTNFTSQVRLTRKVLPHLKSAAAGRLVFIASTAGMYGVRGLTSYSASKGALIAFAQALAIENKKNALRVNILAPYAGTRMTEGQFVGEAQVLFSPEHAAYPAAWLASEACQVSGKMLVTGADHFRFASIMEADELLHNQQLDTALDPTSPPTTPKFNSFPNAEAAFGDFLTSIKSIPA